MDKDEKKLLSTLHEVKALTKYGIVGLVFLFTLHSLLLALGIDAFYVHIGAVLFALILGYQLSKLFRLCFVHRLCVMYVVAMLGCIVHRRYGLFGDYLSAARWTMFVIGVCVSILVIWRAIKAKKS